MRDNRRNDVELYQTYGIHETTKTCEVFGEINSDTVDRVIRNLTILDNLPDLRPINIDLNSDGGCVIEGTRLYDCIRSCKRHINIFVRGQASSMASIILQAGDTRLITKNSFIMIHIGQEGSPMDHVQNKKRWDRFNEDKAKWMKQVYLNKIKKIKPRFTENKLDELLVFDTILSPSKALELGLIDKILD
jgi:ATP-dependent Clp protease protease subunit